MYFWSFVLGVVLCCCLPFRLCSFQSGSLASNDGLLNKFVIVVGGPRKLRDAGHHVVLCRSLHTR